MKVKIEKIRGKIKSVESSKKEGFNETGFEGIFFKKMSPSDKAFIESNFESIFGEKFGTIPSDETSRRSIEEMVKTVSEGNYLHEKSGSKHVYKYEINGKKEEIKFVPSSLSMVDLGFVSKVINHVKNKHSDYVYRDAINASNIRYFEINKKLLSQLNESNSYNKFVEIDLNQAYYQAFKMLGFSSPSIDKYILEKNVSKKGRLVALGALAKRISVTEYKEGIIVRSDSEKYAHGEAVASIFFKCAKMVADLLSDFFDKQKSDEVLLYWTDAIILKRELKDSFIKYSKSKGFEFKEIDVVRVYPNSGKDRIKFGPAVMVDYIDKSGKEQTKPFFFNEGEIFKKSIENDV